MVTNRIESGEYSELTTNKVIVRVRGWGWGGVHQNITEP